jgi:hypothetical protein
MNALTQICLRLDPIKIRAERITFHPGGVR